MVKLDDFKTHATHQKKPTPNSKSIPSLPAWVNIASGYSSSKQEGSHLVQAINCLPYPIFTPFPPAISHDVCTYGISNSYLNALSTEKIILYQNREEDEPSVFVLVCCEVRAVPCWLVLGLMRFLMS